MPNHPNPLGSGSCVRALAARLPACCALALLAGPVSAQVARDYISIVGSSTVYPFSTVVAERFGRGTRFKTPKVESTGSGGGIRLFCNGVGVQHPDIANSSRRIERSELELCARNGVADVIEIKIGYDGIVLANSRTAQEYELTRTHIFLALAKQVPDPADPARLLPNPYERWVDIDPALPVVDIEVLGPPPTSGTRDAFVELVMDAGCATLPAYAALVGADRQIACRTMREDGAFIEAGENDNLIVQKLQANPNALGIFGYSFLEQNYDKVRGSRIDGVLPDFEEIANGGYPVARLLYFYVKKAHIGVIPGIEEFLREFTSESAAGEFGYLSDKGLVPLPEAEHEEVLTTVRSLQSLEPSAVDRSG
ncbi:MAG TPA: substrate-binding domain-containing protein [Gammaproteobacteria bacterium]